MRFPGVRRRGGPDDAPPRRARWRWIRRALAGFALLSVAAVVAVVALLRSLEQPWVKRRVQALARAQGGVEIDYRAARVGLLSGAVIDGLVVRSPSEVRGVAPELVRIDRVEARWSQASLSGRGPALERLIVSGVTLTVVVDEHGRTSLDALSPPGPPSPPSAPTPLSRQAQVLETPFPVGEVDVRDVTLDLVRTDDGHASERTELRGLALEVAATPAGAGTKGTRVKAGLGSPAAPLDLALTRDRDGARAAGHARVWVTLDATSSAASAALDVRIVDQTFGPAVPVDRWLHAEANVRFDAAAGRTYVTIDHTAAGDGAATAEASIEIPDVGDPVVRHAQGDVDLARLLGWVPAGLVPATVERAHVHYQIDSLSQHGAIAGRGSVEISGAHADAGKDRVDADGLSIELEGERGADGAIAAHVAARFTRVGRGGASPFVARDGRFDLRVSELRIDPAAPLATRGEITTTLHLASFDARTPSVRAIVDGLALRAHALLAGHPPYAVGLDAPAARLRLLANDGRTLVDAPLRLEARLRDVNPDAEHPASSRGVAKVTLGLGDVAATLDATKALDALDFALDATLTSLKGLRPLLPTDLARRAPWDAMAVALHSSGRVERLSGASPSIDQKTELTVDHPCFDGVAARSLALSLHSSGTAMKHDADADLRVQALTFGGANPSDDHLTLSAAIDREHPSARVQIDTEGRVVAKVSASASFDPSRHAVPYSIDAHLAGLAPIAPFVAKVKGLEGFDLSQLDLGFSSKGALLGAVSGVTRDGAITIAPHPTLTAGVEGEMSLRAAHFRWAHGDTDVSAPSVAWRGTLHAGEGRRAVDSHLEADALHLAVGDHEVELAGIRDDSTLVVKGDLADPDAELTERSAVRDVQQDFVAEYPIGDLSFTLTASRDRDGLVHVTDLQLANGAGGTTLATTGNVELGDGRRTLSLTTKLTQDLGHLTRAPSLFVGRGKLAAEANVTSPDLGLFRVHAQLKGDDVSVAMPRMGIEMKTANGEVPITVTVDVDKNGVALRPDEKRSPYSMLRFADQHPLLSRSGFLSIASLKTPWVSIAPLVGNLEIQQNVVSLRQFEMGVRGGSITGQCGIDWDGVKSTVELHVRASGVQSSHGEPFDGNIAVVISAGDRTVEGRAEILRIGERHLLDLLDLQDPMHVDPAMNRVRTALTLGYPDRLRLVFDHGFASARLELGGLARLVSIGELRGIPMGPIVDKLLAPMLDPTDTKDAP